MTKRLSMSSCRCVSEVNRQNEVAASAVTDLTLSHFRSHAVTRLTLDRRPVAIHGANGAGKTNILEAVSLLSPGRGLRRSTLAEMTRMPDALGWKLKACVVVSQQMYEIETGFAPNQPRHVKVDDKASTQVALASILRILWLVPSMDRLWIEGADGRRRFLDRMAMSFEPRHAEAVLTYEKAMRERNRLLKDMVRDAHWYRALEQQMAESGARITANRASALARIAEAQTNAETAFPASELTLTHPDDALPSDSAGLRMAFEDNRMRDLHAGRTLIGPHRCDVDALYRAKEVPASQCSTGEQKALLISLVLSNARALAEDAGVAPLILLDEVAAHLDAHRRAALYDEIRALGSQAWMTGTGPELFAELGRDAQHVVVSDQGGASVVTVLE